MATTAARHALLVDGEEVETGAWRTVHDPATGEPLAEVADGSADDARRAVAAARAAHARGDWSRALPGERAAVLDRLATLLEERAEEVARLESRNTGKPLKFSTAFDLPSDGRQPALLRDRDPQPRGQGRLRVQRQPHELRPPRAARRRGQVAPWNYPMWMAIWKIGPALAAGNSVVLKPAERDAADHDPARPSWRSRRACRPAS